MVTLSALFERFLRERCYLKNVTPKMVIWYETAFLALTRATTLSGPDELSKPLLHDFVVGLRQRGLSPVSCNTYIKALNSFFAWLRTEGHIRESLIIAPQRTEKRVLQILTTEHSSVSSPSNPSG